MAHFLLQETKKVKDVMSGFFMLKRDVIDDAALNPIGFKILLEIVVRGRYNKIKEVPYTFKVMKSCKSHFGLKEIWSFIIHIYRLL